MGVLKRVAKAVFNEVTKPKSFAKDGILPSKMVSGMKLTIKLGPSLNCHDNHVDSCANFGQIGI